MFILPALCFWRSQILVDEFQAVITQPVLRHFHFMYLHTIPLQHIIIRSLSGTSSFSNDTVRFTAVSAHACYNGNLLWVRAHMVKRFKINVICHYSGCCFTLAHASVYERDVLKSIRLNLTKLTAVMHFRTEMNAVMVKVE